MLMDEQNIIFFDGVCGLCNKTVDFVLREDREQTFLYSPLQGETFRQIARDHPETLNANSLFVLIPGPEKEILLRRSDAFLYILNKLPRYRSLARVGLKIPASIRDAVYRLIAATRYQIWGKRDSCRLPSAGERVRFLP
jgi:predicted DCC family thiol-disulfide oxidoreductase YuxK